MSEFSNSLEGFVRPLAPLVPTGEEKAIVDKKFVTENQYVQGAPQVFDSIEDLVAFHPFRMKEGMPATVLNHPDSKTITDFRLAANPSILVNDDNNSIITMDNWWNFWIEQSRTIKNVSTVYQFAPDAPGGGQPPYPYSSNPGFEQYWSNTRDDSKGHRWMRTRNDEIDTDPADGIYDNWSPPISIGGIFTTGDYVENRFKRQNVSPTPVTNGGGFAIGKYYIVEAGTLTIEGNLSDHEIGNYGNVTTAILGVGRTFKFVGGIDNVYTFSLGASLLETVAAPPRYLAGQPNDLPEGWIDTIPPQEDPAVQLWQITGQKSVYGRLKSDWIVKKIIEDPNLVRYSNSPIPDPNSISDAGINDECGVGTTGDTNLNTAGWVKDFDDQNYMAVRSVNTDELIVGTYTQWFVQKINEESGEYVDRVFKLFDLNLDSDSPGVSAPVTRDPSNEGWSDVPLQETDTQINFVSEAVKFFNGELKTPWSLPVPYTGKDSFTDYIETDLGDNFKYDSLGVPTPTQITLTARVFKGLSDLSENENITITYEWERVYNDGNPDSTIAGTELENPNFYLVDPVVAPIKAGQQVVVKPGAVDGTAIFRVTQTVELSPGNTIVFEEEISILDITDGKDAKSFDVSADNQIYFYDSGFNAANVTLRAYWSNLVSPTLKWFIKNGGSWDLLTNGVGGYTISGNTLVIATTGLFASDTTKEEKTFAVSTVGSSNPEDADFDTTFSDYITISKLSGLALGAPGVDALTAILSNESHTVVLNNQTGAVIDTPELNKAYTVLQLYDGTAIQDYGVDYSVVVASDGGATVTATVTSIARSGGGTDAKIYLTAWNAASPAVRNALITITITYGLLTLTKVFTLSSTMDAPGAELLDLDSDSGFVFGPVNFNNKNLTARIYDTNLTSVTKEVPLPDASLWRFSWNIGGAGWGGITSDNDKVIQATAIRNTGTVSVRAYKMINGIATLFRERSVLFTDVKDGRTWRAFTSNATKPTVSQKLTNQSPLTFGASQTVSGVVWRLSDNSHWDTNTPKYAQDAQVTGVNPDGSYIYTWYPVYQIGGEKGDQGSAGYSIHMMYIASLSSPAFGAGGNTSTIAQMKTAGWTSKVPVSIPAGQSVWRSETIILSQSGVDVLTYDSNGDPKINGVMSTLASGAIWQTPIKVSGANGTNGSTGATGAAGDNGWSPVFSIAVRNTTESVLRLTDWVGGTGTKPAINTLSNYIGAAGLTNLAGALNIRGPAGSDATLIRDMRSSGAMDALNTLVNNTNITVIKTIANHSITPSNYFVLLTGSVSMRNDTEAMDGQGILKLEYMVNNNGTWLTLATGYIRPADNEMGVTSTLQGHIILNVTHTSVAYRITFQQIYGGGSYRSSGYVSALRIQS